MLSIMVVVSRCLGFDSLVVDIGPRSQAPAEAAKDHLRKTMNETAEREGLLLKAESIALEELSEIKGRMKKVMMQAAETGTLAKELEQLLLSVPAAPATPAQPAGPVGSEKEALRSNVREIVQESLASGKLEEGLQQLAAQKASKPSNQSELQELGEKLRGVLEEASSSGKLEEALQLLQEEQQETIKAAPEDDLEAVRSNLCTVVEDAPWQHPWGHGVMS